MGSSPRRKTPLQNFPLQRAGADGRVEGQGISSGSGQGISSGSLLGISSGSLLGISSGSGQGISSGSTAAIGALLLAGPVSSVNAYEGFFVSMGQQVYGSPEMLTGLRVGDFVMVGGQIGGAGIIEANTIVDTGARYVPGSTEVFVTGIPSLVDSAMGSATIGSLEVDYTPSMGRSDFRGIGAAVTVIGTQPALGGKMIGNEVQDKTDLFLRD